MSKDPGYSLGKILCKGSGLKAYFEIKSTKKDDSGKIVNKTFRYEVGSLSAVMAATNRQVSWNYVAGSKVPVGVNKGLRSMYGTVVFTQLDQGIVASLISDVRVWNATTATTNPANTENFGWDLWSLSSVENAGLSSYSDDSTTTVYQSEILHLDDLPPVDIVIIGAADSIDEDLGIYKDNQIYQYVIKDAVFVSDNFGISAGAPLHNVSTKILILGGVEGWSEVQ
jgi:hypothetical protein